MLRPTFGTPVAVVKAFTNLADATVSVTELEPDPRGDPRNHYTWDCAGCGEHAPRPMARFIVETRASRHAGECSAEAQPPETP